jgi:hypothetical protein
MAKMTPLTKNALEMLMDCHEREILQQEPCNTYLTQTARGLVIRGFFTSQMYTSPTTGKTYMAFYVTEAGKEYLEKYAKEKNKPG